MTPSTSKLATRRPEQSTLENKRRAKEREKNPIKAEFLFLSLKWGNCDNVTDRPAVHDGRVVFSVLLLAEFNEGRFLLACTAASAV